MYSVVFVLFFFFFQAEDGIRDLTCDWSSDVCSSDLRFSPTCAPAPGAGSSRGAGRGVYPGTACTRERRVPGNGVYPGTACTWKRHVPGNGMRLGTRSEERRVGKEWRMRWWEDLEEKE